MSVNEATVEDAAISWFGELGYETLYGPEIAPTGDQSERAAYTDVVLVDRLRRALTHLNPLLGTDDIDEAMRQVLRIESPSLVAANRNFHKLLRDGVPVEVKRDDGTIGGQIAKLIDYDEPENNDWVALNQFTVKEGQSERRPDVMVFVNGLPLGLIELKNIGDEDATVDKAYKQLQTYKKELPTLLTYNEVLVASDGQKAKIGSLTAGPEWFKAWPTIDTEEPVGSVLELETLIRGVFDKSRFLKLVRDFSLFEDDTDSDRIYKILAGYHQFHAARKAVERTVEATSANGDRRIGVVWHTQGSGKSFTMLFYSGLVISSPQMNNPTLVVLTDRNDLDDQLFGQFQRCSEILRQQPIQADSVEHLRELLQVASGGVIFTTVHKFAEAEGQFPVLTDRKNVVVMADEAHRSQYGFTARKKKNKATGEETVAYGFARNIRDALPNASFIGFTGTPVELDDKNTRAVFGDYISVYDIQRAVDDKATVPIYYESRVIKMALEDSSVETIDEEFEEVTEGAEVVIVRDMWLTGFDAPSMHTMYIDKPMQGHGLMQAIARVNRVFKE